MQKTKNEINFIELISDFINFLKNTRTIIFIFIILGLSFGFFINSRNASADKVTYQKSSIITSTVVSNDILVDILASLDIENKTVLAKQLKLPVKTASKLKELSVTINKLTTTIENDNENESKINLDVSYTNKTSYNQLINGVINFVNDNPYLIKQKQLLLKKFNSTHQIINKKLIELENRSHSNYSIGQDDKTNFETSYVGLYEKLQDLEYLITEIDIIKIISTSNAKTINTPKGLITNLVIFTFLSFIFSLFVGWSMNIYKKVVAFKHNESK